MGMGQDDAEDTFTIACVRTIGDDTTFSAFIYTQDSTSQTALYPDDADNVVGFTYDAQAPDYLEEDEDHVWQATSDYTSLVGESDTDGNKIYACYLAKELPRSGATLATSTRPTLCTSVPDCTRAPPPRPSPRSQWPPRPSSTPSPLRTRLRRRRRRAPSLFSPRPWPLSQSCSWPSERISFI